MSLKTVYGDILTPNANEVAAVICHQVNMRGVMGAGLARQIRNKFPSVYDAYKVKCSSGTVSLGDVQFVSMLPDNGCVIVNIFGQDGYGTDKVYTDYGALRKAFAKVVTTLHLTKALHNAIVRIPYGLGCGLAGGNWNTVLRIIQEELVNEGVEVEIWKLPEKTANQEKPHVFVYTDGACKGNPGPGGYGAILVAGDKEKEISGGEAVTTNNKMELMGAIAALETLKRPCKVTLTSDSKYLVDAVDKKWVYNWQNNGWKKSDGKPALNVDLWQRLLYCLTIHDVEFVWVKGHDGHPYNERCDKLAVREAEKFTK